MSRENRKRRVALSDGNPELLEAILADLGLTLGEALEKYKDSMEK